MKELFLALLEFLGLGAPTVDKALEPMFKVRDNLVKAQVAQREKADEAREEMLRQQDLSKEASDEAFRATKYINKFNKDLEE